MTDGAGCVSPASKPLPPRDELLRLLDYDPEAGRFRWKAKANARMSDSNFLREPGTIRAGYRDICINFESYGAHRLAWKYVYGVDPQGEIDHINGDRLDNRICNLRDATASDQRRNAARPSHNTSGIVGVAYRADKRKWRAFMKVGGKSLHLGYFATSADAVDARARSEREHGFHPNHGRAA